MYNWMSAPTKARKKKTSGSFVILGLVVIMSVALAYGSRRWQAETKAMHANLEAARRPIEPKTYDPFDEQGVIESVRAEARGRAIGRTVIPTPWEGRWSDYEFRDGMLIPLAGEVAWMLGEGPKPYWRGRITNVLYEWAQ
jgi:Family of unknown function (DUF6920)